jgi:hypothetical protein
MVEVVRFKVGEEVTQRSEVVSTVDLALMKFIGSNWYEKDTKGEILFYDEEKYVFFEKCLFYLLRKKGIKLSVKSELVKSDSTKSNLAIKQLLG